MVLTHTFHETVFTVLADAARHRSRRSLVTQLAVSAAAIAGLLVVAPQWWSLALIGGAFAAYAAWGLLDSDAAGPARRWASSGVAVTGTACALAGVLGLAFTLFTGTAAGTYAACGDGARTRYCQAMGSPARTTRPIP